MGSEMCIGDRYYQGHGVIVSYPRAFLWWSLAQDLNIGGASQNIDMITKKMSKVQYRKAKEMYLMCMQNTLYNCTKKLDLF